MADISELLSQSDPETLKKLLGLRDSLRMAQPYESLPGVPQSIPKVAPDYSIFNKQISQDIVNQASIPGNAAEQSAKVFAEAMPEGIAEGQNLVPYAGEAAGAVSEAAPSMLSKVGRVAGKVALPLTVASEFLHSTPVASDSEEMAQKASAINPPSYTSPKADNFTESGNEQFGIDPNELAALKAKIQRYQLAGMPSPIPGGLNVDDSTPPMISSTPISIPGVTPTPSPVASPLPSDSDESSDEESSPVSGTKALMAKLQNLKSNPTKNGPSIRDSIATLLGKTNDQFAGAQEARNSNQLLALLGQAGSTIGSALTPLAPKDDQSFWTNLQKAAGQPIEDLSTKQSLESGALKGQMLKGQVATEMEKSDPTSSISELSRKFYKQLTGNDAPIDSSAEQLEKLDKNVALFVSKQLSREAAKTAASLKSSTGISEKQDKLAESLMTQFTSSRQAPDIKQALLDRYSASKALKILSNYSNLDDVPLIDAQAIATDIGKIMQGGVPQKEELRGLIPNTFTQQLTRGYQNFVNKPTPALAGEFMKHFNTYLNDLKTNSNELLKDRFEKPLDVYNDQGLIKPHMYKSLHDAFVKPLEITTSPNTSALEPKIQAFMKANNINRDEAERVLKESGRI